VWDDAEQTAKGLVKWNGQWSTPQDAQLADPQQHKAIAERQSQEAWAADARRSQQAANAAEQARAEEQRISK
jgi:hypothetical protein